MEYVPSLGLALVPPGNVIRAIAEIRRSFWLDMGEVSARSYFDYPVIAWLGSAMDTPTLEAFAARCALPFELSSMYLSGNDVFISFSDGLQALADAIEQPWEAPSDDSPFRNGPFDAGRGCYCASIPKGAAIPSTILERAQASPLKAKTFVIAQVELLWSGGRGLQSSWTTLSQARSAGSRG